MGFKKFIRSYTKNVRYQSYLDVAKINSWDDGTWGVILGHNHDDCIENIFTNIINKTKYKNLYGMEFKSLINFKSKQICFIRPMLNISKEQIYDFAHQTNIPYLFDSTPKWSQRGKIRDIVRPALIEWNKSSIEGIDELSKVMTDCIDCVDMIVDVWIGKIIGYNELNNKDKLEILNKLVNLDSNKSKFFELKVIKIKFDDF